MDDQRNRANIMRGILNLLLAFKTIAVAGFNGIFNDNEEVVSFTPGDETTNTFNLTNNIQEF